MKIWVLMLMMIQPAARPGSVPVAKPTFKVVYLGPFSTHRACAEKAENMQANGAIRGLWDCRPADADDIGPVQSGDRG